MARTKKTAEAVVETVKETVAAPVVEEVKAPAKKAAAKKTTAAKKAAEPKAETKTAAKKPAAKKAPASKKVAATTENLYIQVSGNEITSAALIEKAKADAGVKAPKSVDVYVRPEINMVYYVIDGETFGNFELF